MGRVAEKFKLPSGMGALIRYTPDGPWTWQRYDRGRRKNVCTPTRQVNRSKAEQYAYQEVAKREGQKFRLQDAAILFASVAEEYSAAREQGRYRTKLRRASLLKLRSAIKAFGAFVGASYQSLQIDKIDTTMLNEFVLHEARRVSADAANRNLDYVRGISGYAFAKHYILHDPSSSIERAIKVSSAEEDDEGLIGWPCPIAEEVRQILTTARPVQEATGTKAFNGSAKGRMIYRGINANDYSDFLTAICLTGLRIAEACFLTWNDVDLNSMIIRVRPGHKNGKFWQPKTKFSIRRIAIVPELESILRRLSRTNRHSAWVFETKRGTQVHPHNVSKRFRQICEGLRLQKHYVVHSLRKYWASTVAQQGMDWRVMLKMFGHSDFKLILSTYYEQNDDVRLVEEASKIDFGLTLPEAV